MQLNLSQGQELRLVVDLERVPRHYLLFIDAVTSRSTATVANRCFIRLEMEMRKFSFYQDRSEPGPSRLLSFQGSSCIGTFWGSIQSGQEEKSFEIRAPERKSQFKEGP